MSASFSSQPVLVAGKDLALPVEYGLARAAPLALEVTVNALGTAAASVHGIRNKRKLVHRHLRLGLEVATNQAAPCRDPRALPGPAAHQTAWPFGGRAEKRKSKGGNPKKTLEAAPTALNARGYLKTAARPQNQTVPDHRSHG